jgi:transcriptional regulator with XRE-family HTH domain
MSDAAEQQIRLGRRLRVARENAGLSQEAVAKRLGLQRPAVSEIEAGRRRVAAHELAKMSDLYHASMEWLVSGETDTPEKLELAARGLAGLKPDELDKILDVLKSLRDPKRK